MGMHLRKDYSRSEYQEKLAQNLSQRKLNPDLYLDESDKKLKYINQKSKKSKNFGLLSIIVVFIFGVIGMIALFFS